MTIGELKRSLAMQGTHRDVLDVRVQVGRVFVDVVSIQVQCDHHGRARDLVLRLDRKQLAEAIADVERVA